MSRVFVLGNATVDLTLSMAAWPREGETVLADALTRGPGGKGLNQAFAARRAGAQVRLCAPVGDDDNGAFLRDFVRRDGSLDVGWRATGAVTDISTIWIGAGGENMIVSSALSAHEIEPSEVGMLLRGLGAGDYLLVQGNLRAETTLAACNYARQSAARVVVNFAPIAWPMRQVLDLADVVVCNRIEAEALSGARDAEAARHLAGYAGGAVFLTLGAEGAIVADAGDLASIAAPRVEARDTSGAGDVAAGYLVAALASGRSLRQAAETAVRAASLSVTRAGTLGSCPTRAELAACGGGT